VSSDEIEVRRRLAAPAAEIFAWWTDPKKLARWISPVGTAEASVDQRVGGSFRVTMRGAGMEIEHAGEYLEVDPPHRLVFTWRSPYTGPEPSVVTVELESDGDGTALRLRHAQLPEAAAASHAEGWGGMLARLAEAVAPVAR
jgi:uncharacterized protein YndB with AHSA1/START domain